MDIMSIRALKPASSVEQLLHHRQHYPDIAPCMNPECRKNCSYPGDVRGRRPLYCSPDCARDFAAKRYALVHEVEALEAAIAAAGPQSKTGGSLRKQLAHARWHLARYGGDNTPTD